MGIEFINKFYLGKKVKVYFKPHDSRIPMIGIFVNMKDSEEYASKGFIRFVNQTKLDFWQTNPNIGLTKIYKTSDFQLIKEVNG